MRLATLTLATVVAVTFAFTGGASAHRAKHARTKHTGTMSRSMSWERSSGDAITTGSGAPQNNPNLSRSSQTSDTGRKVP